MKKSFILLLLFFIVALTHAQNKPYKVYVFIAEECPISIYMTGTLKNISEAYFNSADFFLVFPLENSTQETAATFKTAYSLDSFKIILDPTLKLTKSLKATVTPEAVIMNYADMVVYRGRINDAYLEPGKRRHNFSHNDLSDALQILSNNKTVPRPWKPAVGCLITID